MTTAAICLIASFLLGGVPFGFLLGKLKGIDIRTVGSRNIGATNLTRAAGRPWGVAAFTLDYLKGLAPVVVTGYLVSLEVEAQPGDSSWLNPIHIQILAGALAILGHVFPVYLRFRGGKGVATTFGVMTAMLPFAALAAALSWALVFLATRTVSIASLLTALVFPVATFALYRDHPGGEFYALEAFAVGVALLILLRHRENIQRLLRGKEHHF